MSTRCISPFGVKDKIKNQTVNVPCGKCPPCKSRRASNWSFRLMQEEKIADKALFVTITYDTKNVPITPKGFMSLDKRDFQLFMKRLRKAAKMEGIKYYAVGEYGGKTMRPHYHIILFNCDEKHVEAAWQKGTTHYGTVTGASIGYTLKYISKDGKIPLHQNDDRVPEFSLMSKGLGKNYLTPKMIKWHLSNLTGNSYVALEDGKKASLPRYYKQKIYADTQQKAIAQHFATIEPSPKDYTNPEHSRYNQHRTTVINKAKRSQNKHCKL